jgi:hypothetical protein
LILTIFKVLCILWIPLSFLLWICEIFWDDFLNYDVTHAGRVRDERGGGKGRDNGGDDGVEGEEWQDTDTDASDNDDLEVTEGEQRPQTPSQHTETGTEEVDSVMQGQLYQREASSTAWDEGASPKARAGYTRRSEDELGLGD